MQEKAFKELERRVDPNTFVTLTLKQGIEGCGGTFIPGSHEAYERVVKALYRQMEKRLYGKRAWRRNKDRMLNITTLEGRFGTDWHVHACIRRPAHVTLEKFEQVLRECWKHSAWFRPNFKVEEYRGGGVRYILKEGQESLLPKSSYF